MLTAWHSKYAHPLPANHKFPMIKYNLLKDELLKQGILSQKDFFEPVVLDEQYITKVHSPEYYRNLVEKNLNPRQIRLTGFPLDDSIVERERLIMYGSMRAAELAITHGFTFNIAGGTHHAFSNRGEGFCLLNDLAIAAMNLIDNHGLERVLIVDLDVHQGNGTAEIFKNEKRVFTFSMHGQNNYPLKKEVSDLDIALPDDTDDKKYNKILEENLEILFAEFKPQFVLYQCGADVLASDKFGRLSLSIKGVATRDKIVFEKCYKANIPVFSCMGGGYSPNINDIVQVHINTFLQAKLIY